MNEASTAERVTTGGVRHDLLASIVVFLVALPLCMGIAIASGMEPAAGIITGVIGGIVVGTLSGAPLQVSGPAAGLAVVVYDIVQREGPAGLAVIVFVAGGLQLTAGLLRFGQWFRAVSPAVIHGMLAGIGVLIFAGQFHVMVDDAPKGSGLTNLLSLPEAVWKGLTPMDDSSHHLAAMVGLFTILLLIVWKPLVPGKLKAIPAPLVAVAVATAAAALLGLNVNRVPVPENLSDAIRWPTAGAWTNLLDGRFLVAGIAMAFIASAETLLCATAMDKMHRGPRTKYDKELAAQGVGNMLCGLVGALPMTGVIVRSAANVDAGARTRLSAILHGVWLLLFAAMLPQVLRMVPTASLAAVLVYTGYKLINVKVMRELSAYGRSEVAIYAATVITIVAADLLTGVLVGIGLSAIKLLYLFSHLEFHIEDRFAENRTILHLRGAATFIRLPQLAAALEQVRPSTELHVQFERLDYIDHACMDLLMNWRTQHEATGGRLMIDWESLTARFHREERESGPTQEAPLEKLINGRRRMRERPKEAVSVKT
ncbi:MAG: SulP family inorganic anion transporter [Phycisphaerae bacterium]|nr:STAS domain-containing protein [Phycisphaerae bacterium]NUQ45674.1 SulP family inorganic anion transporter [Phycisphaerae bacterium]